MRGLPRPVEYVVAALLAAVALSVRMAADRWLGGMQPFASGFVVIAASAWWFGWRPAVLAAVISYLGGTFYFVEPRGHIGPGSVQALAAMLNFFAAAGMIIAIGERARRAEQALAQANADLREADQRKDAFLATLSHELRNPIGVITNGMSILERLPLDERPRATLSILSRQIGHMQRLVDDLLDIGRITRGRLTLRIEPTDVRASVEHAVDANRHTLTTRRQHVSLELPEAPTLLGIDHARMVQVVSNLIDNASKYSPEGAEVSVRVVQDDGVMIEVSDNGPGIDPTMLPKVFDLFEQGGSSHSDGLGLGLGLCRHLVELHGGRITAERNPTGQGTTFKIYLPRVAGPTRAGG